MENAHLRLGRLHYELISEKRRTSISVILDRLVAETEADGEKVSGKVQMLSVLGADAEIAAISAALAKGTRFRVQAAGIEPLAVYLDSAECFRGTISVPGRNRSLRHLLAISQEWVTAATSATPSEIFLIDSSPEFIWTNLAYIYGLPARPEWASWFHQRLVAEESVVPLFGIGCDPVKVKGTRDQFLSWLGEGVASGVLELPPHNGPIVWPNLSLNDILMSLGN